MFCAATNCERKVLAKGLCGLHYKRMRAGKSLDEHDTLFQSVPRGGLAALGLTKHHPFYLAWVNMKTRCDNPKSTQWEWYGGRGITYDKRWRAFSEFHRDMWEDWALHLTLDRVDSELHYNRANCRWATMTQQALNRRAKGATEQPRQ